MNFRIISTLVFVSVFGLISHAQAQIQQPFQPMSDSVSLQQYIHTVTMSSLDIGALLAEDSIDASNPTIPLRFGFSHSVNLGVTNVGTWDTLGNGDLIWRLRIISSGAYSINLNFDKFLLPTGGRLFVYNERKTMMIGAFTETNNLPDSIFATRPVKGDTIIIEYNHPASNPNLPLLNIDGIVHAYRNMFSYDWGFDRSQLCNRNVHCPEGEEWEIHSRSVAMVLVDNGTRWCSGALINNAMEEGLPLFITADHCVCGNSPSNMIFIFGYESDDCNKPQSEPSMSKSINGAQIVGRCCRDYVEGGKGIALLYLSQRPPVDYGVYYAGWSRDVDTPSSVAIIHHPMGDIKKILISNSITSDATAWKGWIIETPGLLEKGSSGSPVFDQNGRIIGVVYGTVPTDNCSTVARSFYAARLDVNMECEFMPPAPNPPAITENCYNVSPCRTLNRKLKMGLDPGSTGILRINGYNPTSNSSVSITVDQKRASDDRMENTKVGRWSFANSNFDDLALDITGQPAQFQSSIGALEVLKGLQDRVENPDEKFHVWIRNTQSLLSNVQNHKSFMIRNEPTVFTSQFNDTKGNVTIKTDLFETGTMGGEIRFHDPWYIDLQDPLYNDSWRNRGMKEAFPHSRSIVSPGFNPDFSTTFQGSDYPYMGVFLNQSHPTTWNPPLYVVSVSPLQSFQTINDIEYAFLGWHSPNQKAILQYPKKRETGVIFDEDYAEVSARLKAHLLSTSSTPPTRNNSQRKIVIQDHGNDMNAHHIVYESGNRVFYAMLDDTKSWQPEELVSDFNTTSSNPSIALAGDYLFVVYVEDNEVVIKKRRTFYWDIKRTFYEEDWTEILRQPLQVPMASMPVIAADVVEISEGGNVIPVVLCASVWEEGDKTLKFSIVTSDGNPALIESPPGSGNWVDAVGRELRSGRMGLQTQIQPRYPSIVVSKDKRDVRPRIYFGIAWNESGVLYYDDLSVEGIDLSTHHVTLGAPAEIVQASAGQSILPSAAPSLSLSHPGAQGGGYPIVAYACTGLAWPIGLQSTQVLGSNTFFVANPPWYPCVVHTPIVAVRLRNNPLFSAQPSYWNIQTYTSRDFRNSLGEPSISVTGEPGRFLYQGVRVSSNDGNNGISVAKVTGSKQSFDVSHNADGYDPNLPVRGYYYSPFATNLLQLYSRGASSRFASLPFNHAMWTTEQDLRKTTVFATHHVRQLFVSSENESTFALYGIHLPRICDGMQQEQDVEWFMAVDTTTIQEGVSIRQRMRTESFNVPSGGSMKYSAMLFAGNVDQFEEPFDFVVEFIDPTSGDVMLSKSLTASALPDSHVYASHVIDLSDLEGKEVYMTVSLSPTPDSAFAEVIDLFITDSYAEKIRSRQEEYLPAATITLEENNPNPFRATTSLTFTLSEACDARLAVYDLHGRLVKVLVNGTRDAGRHTLAFNASSLPTGVYIYRLDASGQTLMRRMAVVK